MSAGQAHPLHNLDYPEKHVVDRSADPMLSAQEVLPHPAKIWYDVDEVDNDACGWVKPGFTFK